MTTIRSVPDWENREMPEKEIKSVKEKILEFINSMQEEKFKDFTVKWGHVETGFNTMGLSKRVRDGRIFLEIEIYDNDIDGRK